MVIENRDAVVAGVKLKATYKKQHYVCTVEAGDEDKLAFIYGGKSYGSPSSAGSAVIGTACNGWRFWSLETGETSTAKPQPKAKVSKSATKPATKTTAQKPRVAKPKPTILHRHDSQTDLAEGQVRWVCNACLKHFIVEGSETPEACPEGHHNDDPDLSITATTDEVEG